MKKSAFDLNVQNSSIDGKIVASIERVSQAIRVLLWNESTELALSPIQIQVLIFLLHHDPEKRKVGYLASEFNLTKATISETVKTLEQKHLLTKEWATNDTRSYIIHLTKKGKTIAQQTSYFAHQIQAPIEKLQPEQKENLFASLLQIIQHLNETGIISIQRMCFSCSYYKPNSNSNKHFCNLLKKELSTNDLRVDCPEHILSGHLNVG